MSFKFNWEGFSKPNRKTSHRAKLGRGWCTGCDRYKVALGNKYPIRGTQMGPKRLKKEALPLQ